MKIVHIGSKCDSYLTGGGGSILKFCSRIDFYPVFGWKFPILLSNNYLLFKNVKFIVTTNWLQLSAFTE